MGSPTTRLPIKRLFCPGKNKSQTRTVKFKKEGGKTYDKHFQKAVLDNGLRPQALGPNCLALTLNIIVCLSFLIHNKRDNNSSYLIGLL